ncbi:MAG TPA: ABC transporter ATP-binding protein [Pseudomonadales bacterium]|nr:ABC transporter ATP-binding protein [Gammaproteobacteria bacterium]MDP6024280.1 ABC transporter ATP-binding protein [Pseudomonadales bacterium]MDP7315700.1 ABC transporter ATP-binding protein [Pseudomonadales bacterium]MDP7452049.1 ABC transporter ATP-binding protein [Arenicellales bacterium]HJP53070.1 ABC transporter ATP-binding protein [Pseudomonadales bacterium]
MARSEYILLDDVHRTYQEAGRSHAVLKGLSLAMNSGEIIALLGRSGSGKSTLLNVISGIDKPDQGQVVVNGIDLTALSERELTLFRREHIGFIYQFFNLIPTLTARENIALVLELNGYSPTAVREISQTMLAAVDLSQAADRFPDRMSGGEQQRVAIARALAHSPGLVLADELTGTLDAETGQLVLKLLQKLVSDQGGTLLLVTHSLAVAKTADRVLTLEDGQLAEQEGSFAW